MIKMRKLFLKISMLLFVLGMSTNVAWGSMDGMAPYYVAELTAKVSSTGGGKVYVAKDQNPPAEEEAYATTNTQHGGRPAYMPGVAMAQVPFVAWQTASDGYYFVGWSYSDNGFDLGKFNPEYPQTEEYSVYANLYDVSSEKSKFKVTDNGDGDETNDAPVLDENGEYQYIIYNPAKYTLYATFEPVRISKYSLSGDNTNDFNNGTNKWESTQEIEYTFSGEEIDEGDFKSLAFEPEAAGWTVSGLTVDPEKKTGTAIVTFSTESNEFTEYSAKLRLTTKADITMDVLLSARTRVVTGEEKDFALYDGKDYKEDVNFADLATKISEHSCTKPLIKLNKDYISALTISQDLSLDLCGHNLTSLSVSEGATVTLVSSPYGGSITGNVTNSGTLTLMGNEIGGAVTNNGTLYQNGATIHGAVTNNGTMTTTDGIHLATLTSNGTLTINGGVFTPATGIAIDVTGGTADIKKGTINGQTFGIQSAGTTTIEKLAVISGVTEKALKRTGGVLTVNCGKFTDPDKLADGAITFKSAYFLNETGKEDGKVHGKKLWRNTSGAEYRDGYKFFAGDYSEAKKAGVSVCHIGGTSYSSLEAALDYANNAPDKEHKAIIIMDNDYALPAGYYTLPANAVLIVPKDNDQGNENKTVERVTMADDDNSNWLKPERFRTLTLLAGVTLDVYGTIEVTGSQFSTNAAYTSAVYGPYGCIQMNEGSKMNLQNGSELRAWGYITGDIDYQDNDHNVPMGEIDARRGATVREQFQMGDWKGAVFSGLGLIGMGSAPAVFPLTTYFIQNIEVPVKYHPGSKLSTTASVAASKSEHNLMETALNILQTNYLTMSANDIQIIGVTGDIAMFLMEEAADADNTWVRKWYDASKDQQVYEINSGAHIGNLVIPLVSSPMFSGFDSRFPDQLNMNSGQYELPITHNFKLHLLSGTMDFTQSTELLPGAELEIDKEARVYITKTEGVNSGALYVYDADNWGNYAGGVPARHVKYSPVFEGYNEAAEPDVRDIEEKENLQDASIFVHGTFDITDGGCVYTSAGGANIHSTNEDAGTFTFSAKNIYKTVEIVDDEEQEVEHPTVQLKQVSTSDGGGVQEQTFSPAVLQNGDGSDPKETAEIEAGQAILYMNDRWQSAPNLIHFDCYTAEVVWDTYREEITKLALVSAPDNIAEYMVGSQIAAQMFGDTPTPEFYEQAKKTHYYDEACQCYYDETFAFLKTSQIDPYIANAKTEGYDLGKAVQAIYIKPQEWLEITGKAALPLDAETIAGFGVLYETDPNNAVNSYMDYISGLANTPMLIGNDDHTFSDADGAGRLFILVTGKNGDECQWWEVEKKDNLYHCIHPENDTYYFWDPDRVIYEGTDDEENLPGWAEKKFTITWKDKKWGTEDETQDSILATYKVPYGTMADWNSSSPVREPNDDYTYTFTGWTPALAEVTSDITYTATYQENPIKYTIIFKNDGGTEIERHLLARNEFPVCEDLPTRTGFILQWEPQLAAVTGDQTYKATWIPDAPESYAITFYDHNGTMLKPLEGEDPYMVAVDDTPEAPEEDPTGKEQSIEYNYVFDHWSPAIEPVSATGPKVYTAVYRQEPRKYTISFYDETGETKIGEQILAYGETPTAPEVTKKEPEPGMRYTYVWQNMDDASKNIETVTGNANYKPVFDGEPMVFSITLKSNPSGACTFTGAGSYKYNKEVEISLNVKDEDYSFTGWSDGVATATRTMTVTKDTVLVANFNYEAGVTIYWKNEDGSEDLVDPVKQKIGASTTYLGEIPTKPATAQYTYTFYGWSTAPNGEGEYKNGMTPKAAVGGATYYAYFTKTLNQYTVTLRNAIPGACEFRGAGVRTYGTTVNIVATPNGDYEFVKWQETGSTVADFDLVVTGDITLTAIVKEKEKPAPDDLKLGLYADPVTIEPNTSYTDLVITSNGIDASSQIINADNITLYGKADFVLKQDMIAGEWYSVAVPWRVEANGGVYLGGSSTPAVLGKDFEICYYDGAIRAAQGKVDACWVYMKNQSDQILKPGRAYMFFIKHGSLSQVVFRKQALQPLLTDEVSIQAFVSEADEHGGWNGIANPSLYHAKLSNVASGDYYVQFYNTSFDHTQLKNISLVVGMPVYIQAAKALSLAATYSPIVAPAPARRVNKTAAKTTYDVQILASGAAKYADHITVQLDEDKEEDTYVIGKDLSKFGISAKVAQMWINRYDSKLCVNTLAPEEEAVTYPLGIYSPKAGEYTIAIGSETNTEDYALYLTYDGKAIWNLSEGAYTATLQKGTESHYGLRISARAPQVATGVDEALVDGKDATATKVLINNKVFIIRGEKVYNVDGQLVK